MNLTRLKQITPLSTDLPALLLRILFGVSLMINYGWPTTLALFSGDTDYPDPIGMGPATSMALMALAQFPCALMVVLGGYTRIFALPIIGGFLVAFFIFHAADAFADKELSFLYLAAFLGIFFLGSGKYSLDGLLAGRKKDDGKGI